MAPVLEGRRVRLEPLDRAHVADLVDAASDRSSFQFTMVPEGHSGTEQYVRDMIEWRVGGTHVPFAQVRMDDDRAIGCTSFATLRYRPDDGRLFAVEIGHTWLAAQAQRTGINREAKLLMLSHAFGVWGVARVDLKTDARNRRSREAITGIGACFEGVLRSWQPSLVAGEMGEFRDSAMFSVVASEWPEVRRALTESLDR